LVFKRISTQSNEESKNITWRKKRKSAPKAIKNGIFIYLHSSTIFTYKRDFSLIVFKRRITIMDFKAVLAILVFLTLYYIYHYSPGAIV